jgi:hypothetical protein
MPWRRLVRRQREPQPWTVAGSAATILAKACPLDFHPRVCGGACAQSVFGRATRFLRRRRPGVHADGGRASPATPGARFACRPPRTVRRCRSGTLIRRSRDAVAAHPAYVCRGSAARLSGLRTPGARRPAPRYLDTARADKGPGSPGFSASCDGAAGTCRRLSMKPGCLPPSRDYLPGQPARLRNS